MSRASLFAELKRRNVLRAAVLYAGAVWALAQGIAQLGPFFGAPDWVVRWFVIACVIGFPFFMAFAWFFELTPSGLKCESGIDPAESITAHTGRKLNYWIFGVMALAIVLLVTNQFVLHRDATSVANATSAKVIAAEIAKAPPDSIAVLPFTNESSDKQQDYFADGISEDLLNLLTEVQPLRVAARTSSFAFQGKGLGISEIAAKLHVANVLEGSVFKQGDEVRINAQLVRAADGYQIWSRSYDRKLTDIFAIQDGIAEDVVKNLKIKLLGAVPTVRQANPKAYELYLQARQLGSQGTDDAIKSAIALLQQALAIDPRYAPVWVGLAANLIAETSIGMLPNDRGLSQGRAAAERALAIDPSYAPAQAVLGNIAMFQNDLPSAVRHLQRALTLNPSDLDALRSSADLFLSLGRQQSAIAIGQYVVARDPVNPASFIGMGGDYFYAGRFDKAIAEFHTALSFSPDFGGAHYQLGEALLFKGDSRAALAQMQQEKSEAWRLIGLALVYHALGQKAKSDSALAASIAKQTKGAPYQIAEIYAYRSEADPAFAWLDKAVQYADPGLFVIAVDPLLAKLHADPRWLPLLRKLGHAPEQLATIKFTVTVPGAAGASSSATVPAFERSTTIATSTSAQASTAPTGQP